MKATCDYNEINKSIKSLAKRYRSDSAFKAKVDADPAAALRSEGCGDLAPEGYSVKLHLNDEKTMHIVFPGAIKSTSDEDLNTVAGGRWGGYIEYGPDYYARKGGNGPVPVGGPKIGGPGSCMG
ncbi:MAG: hypothetical protein OXU34_01765 [Gammaproteobacteria bacterium]|nr:hypothetical protein [Gammaproteobacteria bacterium]